MKIVQGAITSGFGMRTHPITRKQQMHNGVDIAAPAGTPVYSPADGQVVEKGVCPSRGNYLHVKNGTHTFIFMHLSAHSVNQSQMVKKWQQVGLVGSTGMSTGPHLHFEVRLNGVAIDPLPYITEPIK